MSSSSLQEILACFGQPVASNPAQFMMERAFADLGLDWRYLTLEVAPEALGEAVRGARAMGFRGFHCESPHQEAVGQYLDELSESAQRVGAVTVVTLQDGKLRGDNTNGRGFVRALTETFDPAEKRIVLLGAGAVARAIALELAQRKPAELAIVCRSAERGASLAELVSPLVSSQVIPWEGTFEVPSDTDLVINATSVGGTNVGSQDPKAMPPIATASLAPNMLVADVVYQPPATRLLREAQQRGCATLDGASMLVSQTLINFHDWTGAQANGDLMRDALEEFLGF